MNAAMVKRLVLKDWYFQRYALIGAVAGGALSLWLIGLGSGAAFYFGTILLLTLLITVGFYLAFATVVREREHQTLVFVMTLPITPAEYTMAKVLANLLIFMVPWTVLVLGTWLVISVTAIPEGLLPFAVLVFVQMLAGYVLALAAAIITETQGWVVVALIAANLFFQFFLYSVSHIKAIADNMKAATTSWTEPALLVLLAQVVAIVGMLALTFYVQGRKKDFI